MADDTAETKPARHKELHKLVLIRAFWPEEDKRVSEGEAFETDAKTAMRMIEEGIAKRAPE